MTDETSDSSIVVASTDDAAAVVAIAEALEAEQEGVAPAADDAAPAAEPLPLPAPDPVPVLPAAAQVPVLPEAASVSETSPVPVWPFAVYVGAWALFAGLVVWRLLVLPEGMAVVEASVYPFTVFGGMTLAFAGPVLIVVTWIAVRMTPGARKDGVFVSALAKGAVTTLLGVSLWWIALIIVDQLRLGRIL